MDKDEIADIDQKFGLAAVATLIVLSGGTVFYHYVEKLNFVDAFYFSTITLTTVGYGDIAPQTTVGKLFTTVYILIGIAILGSFANLLLKRQMIRRNQNKNSKN